ncbi:DUF5076 domain-containing protein [Sphingomonas sp.]|uniref:DUF5076 domain-containing protein n=1 Tax=Sphingomonas sp. TaxID=28214 RepID=UPI00286B8085|nr:DUF5076 domain-containing protein [Sphingomonas sp.]
MMFGLRRPQIHPGEISLRQSFPNLTDDAFEVARFWVSQERSFVAVGYPEKWEPELLGSILVESIHTAAVAYSARTGISEQIALSRIFSGFDSERANLASEQSGMPNQ